MKINSILFILLFITTLLQGQKKFVLDSSFADNGVYRLSKPTEDYIFNWRSYLADDNLYISAIRINNSAYENKVYFTSIDKYTGIPNPEFGSDGSFELEYNQRYNYLTFSLPLKKGGFLVYYDVYDQDVTTEKAVASIVTSEGKLDTSFGDNGFLEFGNWVDYGFASFVEVSDGFIGFFRDPLNSQLGHLRKINFTGELDPNFGGTGDVAFDALKGTNFDLQEESFMKYSNGSIYIGYSGDDFEKGQMEILKFDSNGNMDLNFGNNGKFIYPTDPFILLYTMEIDKNGDVILGYIQDDANDVYQTGLLKIKSNGTIDQTFLQNGIFRPTVSDTARFNYRTQIDEDNNYTFLISDNEIQKNGFSIFKCNAAGKPKESFGENGLVYISPTNTDPDDVIDFAIIDENSFLTIGIVFYEDPAPNGDLEVRKYKADNSLSTSTKNVQDLDANAHFSEKNLYVKLNSNKNDLMEFALFDVTGNAVKNLGTKNITQGDNNLEFVIGNDLASSIYFVNIISKDGQHTIKALKGF